MTKEELREASQAGRWEDGGSLNHRSGCLAVAVGVIQPPRPGLFAEKDKLWAAAFRIQQQTANVPCPLERLGANAAHLSPGEVQFPGLGLHLFIYLTPDPLPGQDWAEQRASLSEKVEGGTLLAGTTPPWVRGALSRCGPEQYCTSQVRKRAFSFL